MMILLVYSKNVKYHITPKTSVEFTTQRKNNGCCNVDIAEIKNNTSKWQK